MKNVLFVSCLTFFIFIFHSQMAFADLIDPEYYEKKCSAGEIEVQCSYRSTEPFGPKTYDECARYENNPNYRFLVSEGHSFGGKMKFCFKALSLGDFIVYHVRTLLPLLLITSLLEIPIFLLMIAKSRRALFTIILANFISVTLLYLFTAVFPFTGFYLLLALELNVVIFEAIFIKYMLKEFTFRRILIYSLIANTFSAIFGNMVAYHLTNIIR